MADLKHQITDQVKQAMRDKNKTRLGALRLITAAIKQKEVDERIELDDTQVLAVLDKMGKQLRDSIKQYEDAGRDDLVDNEAQQLAVVQ
ncbi:MAG: GatB/YqeY domain-containing protein, partial [Thiotrichales bacterium]|nr:GatB/YqeY domain-containing protein [Thiotrichales bacterium]